MKPNSSLTAADPAVAEPEVVRPAIKPAVSTEEKTRLAPRYRVLIHNDDITPMEFVVHVLRTVFRKGMMDAVKIMLTAHTTGIALVDVLPLEEAELRIEQAHALARPRKFPLTFTCEPE